MKGERGFTLLEILAALAIAAVGIAAVAETTGSAVSIMQSVEDRAMASWVASNRLAELRMSREWPAAVTRDLSSELGGRVWYLREEITSTPDPDLLRVDLTVFSDEQHLEQASELFGFLARYSAPVIAPQDPQPPEGGEADGEQADGEDATGQTGNQAGTVQ